MSSARSSSKKSTKKSAAKAASRKDTGTSQGNGVSKSAAASAIASEVQASKGAQRLAAKTMSSANPTVEMCRELAAIVEAHSLAELIVDTPEATLTFRRGPGAPAQQALSIMAAPALAPAIGPMGHAAAALPVPAAAEPAAEVSSKAAEPSGGHLVTSPFVGTFYRSPNPDASPYVDVGQRVEKGQVLCIVEAMKLMNEIEADVAGTIEEICATNAGPVEYGQALFRIRP